MLYNPTEPTRKRFRVENFIKIVLTAINIIDLQKNRLDNYRILK